MNARTLRILTVGIAAIQIAAAGQPVAEATGFDNVHIRVADPAKAVEWYVKYLGATSPTAGQLYFGKVLVNVVKTQNPQPSSGSVIDHFGLSYPDIEAKVNELKTGGATILSAPREAAGLFRYAYIEDPWGVKIELVQDPELLGFHHVHLNVPDPAAALAWFQQMFGGARAKLGGRIEGLRYGPIWLFADRTEGAHRSGSSERAIMSLGLRVSDINSAVSALQKQGIPFPVTPRQLGTLWYAFAEDPNGIRVELLQRPLE